MKTPHISSLMKFLDGSPTSYQAAGNLEESLIQQGFSALDEQKPWKLVAGRKYFVKRDQSSVIAFTVGSQTPDKTGLRLAAAHLDSPALKLKPESKRIDANNARLSVEVYGGPIISTWLDRELSIAGRVMVQAKVTGNKSVPVWEPVAIDLKKPLAIIPNVAIHLNREINKGFEYNAQNHLPAIVQASLENNASFDLKQLVATHLKQSVSSIGGMDLFLYDPQPAARVGLDGELLVSGRLDNLAMSHAILAALTEAEPSECLQIGVWYDHEEIGSGTPQGANSAFLPEIIQRICLALRLSQEQQMIALRKSFLVSADMAHAVHPNFREKHDPAYTPLINHGPVIKFNASQKYATTAASSAQFEATCMNARIPVQKVINRSDMPSGSTIGPITAAKLGITTVDIGSPMWAMHSIRETMGVYDHEYIIKALTHYFQTK